MRCNLNCARWWYERFSCCRAFYSIATATKPAMARTTWAPAVMAGAMPVNCDALGVGVEEALVALAVTWTCPSVAWLTGAAAAVVEAVAWI